MKTIWKYTLAEKDIQQIEMPIDAKILFASDQLEEICIWAEVESENKRELRTIEVFGTGHEMYDPDLGSERKYIGSAKINGGVFIFHVYERLI